MKEFMKKGISTLPVVNEILFFVLLAHEVIGLAKDWYKTRKLSTENKPEEDPEKE